MGRGDKRTKKGKIFAGSFGNSRPQRTEGYVAPKAKAPAKKEAEKK